MTMLQKYADHAPTSFDRKGAFLEDDLQEWLLAPCGVTRDSDTLSRSNFTEQLSLLGGESDDVQVHRFGHWGPGWYEIVIVRPNSPAHKMALDIAEKLDNYPVLNEDAYSTLELNEAAEYWEHISVSERLYFCKEHHISIFAARHKYLPQDDDGSLLAALSA